MDLFKSNIGDQLFSHNDTDCVPTLVKEEDGLLEGNSSSKFTAEPPCDEDHINESVKTEQIDRTQSGLGDECRHNSTSITMQHSQAVKKFINAAELLDSCGLDVCVVVAASHRVQFWISQAWRSDLKDVMQKTANLQAGLNAENNNFDMFVQMACDRTLARIHTDAYSLADTECEVLVCEELSSEDVKTYSKIKKGKPSSAKKKPRPTSLKNKDLIQSERSSTTLFEDSVSFEDSLPFNDSAALQMATLEISLKDAKSSSATEPKKNMLCNVCGYATRHAGYLKVHMRKHTGEKPLHCNLCDYKTAYHRNLGIHKQCHSTKGHEYVRPHQCELCNYRAVTSNHLKRHMVKHTGEKPFLCEFCDFRTALKSGLASHIKTHTNDRPYPCTICAFKFTTRNTLSRHMLTHSGEKPYLCDRCDFRTAWPANLLSHCKRHTGEKDFKCELCDYTTAHKNCLQSHMRMHTGSAFDCQHCNYKSTRHDNLLKHVRARHKMPKLNE